MATMDRREFIGGAAAAGAAAAMGTLRAADGKGEIHAVLLHPGRNMWGDWKMPDEVEETDGRKYVPDHIEVVFLTGKTTAYRGASAYYKSPVIGFRCCAYPE